MIKINNKPINVTLFPDNTSQVWQIDEEILKSRYVEVNWKFDSESEFLVLAQLKDLLDTYHIETALILSYLPYGRQDKPISNNTTFGLVTFAKLLNSLNFTSIECVDPHSHIASKLIKNFNETFPYSNLQAFYQITNANLLCYPDKGAYNKYAKKLTFSSAISGDKVRDQKTGQILEYKLHGEVKNKNVMIVDDICDGGATFVILTEELLKKGAKEVNLYVSHGIFSKGLRPLFEAGIKHVFTKDGEVSEHQNNITYRKV